MKKTLIAGLLAAAMGSTAGAAEYPSDDIKFVVPYSAGGGFDTIVRTFAGPMEESLGVNVVPDNLPGASGTRGGKAVHRADADGYTIGIFNIPGLTVAETLGRDIGFPLSEITWIANLAQARYAIAVKSDSPVQSLQDLCDLGRPIKLSDTGKDSTSSIISTIMFDVVGCEISNITGYNGSNDTMIAVMRGEVDATLKPVSSLNKYTSSGDLRIIVTLSNEELVAGVDNTGDLGYPQLANFTINRVVGAPPNLPEDVKQKLAAGIKAATESDAIKEWAAKTKTNVNYMSPEDTSAMMDGLASFYGGYKELLSNR